MDTLQLKKMMTMKYLLCNPLYLVTGKAIVNIEEGNGNKYLVFDSTDKNKEVLRKYKELWNGIKDKIETINDGECNSVESKYGKDFTKIKFNTDDDLPLNKSLNLHILAIIVRSVFEDEGKSCPQIYLDDSLYDLLVKRH